MKDRKLSDKLKFWRAERPDEWTMDEFIRDSLALENQTPAQKEKEITDEQIENIIYQCDGFLKWGVGDHGKQTIRQKIRSIIQESNK